MQRALWLLTGLLLIAVIVAGPRDRDGANAGHYIFATATTGGTFYPVGVAIATMSKQLLANEHGVSLAAISSAGSEENLRMLRNGEAQFAILQGLFGAWAAQGEGRLAGQPPFDDLRVVALLWPNVEHFLARRPLAATGTIDDLADMAGQRFSIGARYSGAEGSARHLLGGLGLDPDAHFDLAFLGYEASANALQDGVIAAMNTPGGAPVGAVTRAMAVDDGLVILSFTEEQRRRAAGDYVNLWLPYTIAAGTYPNQSEDVVTVAQPNILVTLASVPDEHVYQITRMLFEHIGFLHATHAATRTLTLDSAWAELPLTWHEGALRFYRELGVIAQ
jgi:uncharacterized protein